MTEPINSRRQNPSQPDNLRQARIKLAQALNDANIVTAISQLTEANSINIRLSADAAAELTGIIYSSIRRGAGKTSLIESNEHIKYPMGTPVWFDDNPGRVIHTKIFKGVRRVFVHWSSGSSSWADESDLMNDAERAAYEAKRDGA